MEIDVSDLLDDPDFINSFVVTRRRQTVDGHGRTQTSGVTTAAYGSVQPIRPRTMEVMPDYVNVSGAIEIFTRYRLEGPSEGGSPDEVMWKNRRYRVAEVEDWGHAGSGFIHAVCELLQFVANGVPPVPTIAG